MKNYHLHSDFLFRLPMLSFAGRLQSFFEANETDQLNVLKNIYKDKILQEAIYLASPFVYQRMLKWLSTPDDIDANHNDKIVYTLLSYLLRMAVRCTPFGLFAGCGKGRWGHEYLMTVDAGAKRFTRPDMALLYKLVEYIEQQKAFRERLLFYTNNTIYTIGENFRYIAFKDIGNNRFYELSDVAKDKYLEAILEKAQQGATIQNLAIAITEEEVTIEEAMDFVEELIEACLLISELSAKVTGDQMLDSLLLFLKKNVNDATAINELYKQLSGFKKDLNKIDENLYNPVAEYEKIKTSLEHLGVDENSMFQADVFYSNENIVLDKKLAGTLRAGLELLNRITPQRENLKLQNFATRFQKYYDAQEISLLEALDTTSGVGYTGDNNSGIHPLVDNVFGRNFVVSDKTKFHQHPAQEYFLELLVQATKQGHYEIELDDKMLKQFDSNKNKRSPSYALFGQIVSRPDEQQKYPRVLLKSAMGGASKLISRFNHTDTALHNWMQQLATAEQDSLEGEGIIAEIVHLPQLKNGNSLLRTAFRKYEIPVVTPAAVTKEFQVLLADLMVSVKNGEVILRSRKLGKRIHPVLSIAHNYEINALPVYEFLCDLEFQNKQKYLYFSWGQAARKFTFLPRVNFKNLILSRASWILKRKDFLSLLKTEKTISTDVVTAWRAAFNIPDKVLLLEGENELLINFKDKWSVRIFIQQIKFKEKILLEEFLFDEQSALVKNASGQPFTNEFITVFYKEKTAVKKTLPVVQNLKGTRIQRKFPPGSSWLYYKFYGSETGLDSVLILHIAEFINKLLKNRLIDRWFFIRYTDPEPHLRIRFHLNDPENTSRIMAEVYRLQEQLINSKLIRKIQIDTYERELERYGEKTMLWSENFFFADSTASLNFLSGTFGTTEKYRWYYALFAIHQLLQAFGFDEKEELQFLKIMKSAYEKEFTADKHLRKQMRRQYNLHHKILYHFYQNKFDDEVMVLLKKQLSERQNSMFTLGETLQQKANKTEIEHLASSHIHMLINRIFKSRQREYELILYSFLFKLVNQSLQR